MIGANDYLKNIPKQFISVSELLGLFSKIEKTTLESSAQWLLNHIHILNKSKKLVLKNSYTLIEYEYNDNDFYNCPIETIRLIANDEDEEFSSEYVGFSRFQLLKDLESIGLGIDKNILLNSHPYISKSCYESDDNFYKNQCVYLYAESKQRLSNEVKPIEQGKINHLYLLDKDNQAYAPKAALLMRLIHDIITLDRFNTESTKQKRIAMCLDDYGQHYGVRNTSTNVEHFSNIINTRDKSKDIVTNTMSKILSKG